MKATIGNKFAWQHDVDCCQSLNKLNTDFNEIQNDK